MPVVDVSGISEAWIAPLTLAGLPSFAPITFHLFASYSLIASSSAFVYGGQC